MAFPFIKPMNSKNMNGIIKLKENYSFRRAYKKGKALVSPYFVIYAVKTRRGVRLGITAGKKLGCAVKRNRAKRVITAAFRVCLPNIPSGYDFVIVARTRILDIKSTAAAATIKSLLRSAGIWSEISEDEQELNKPD